METLYFCFLRYFSERCRETIMLACCLQSKNLQHTSHSKVKKRRKVLHVYGGVKLTKILQGVFWTRNSVSNNFFKKKDVFFDIFY